MAQASFYFKTNLHIMLIVIPPFDEIYRVFHLPLAEFIEKLLRCHPVSILIDAETFSYGYKGVYG
jgi:hypothetical protein